MIHNIARGICLDGDKILLAYQKKLNYYFLPGGHIERNESAMTALKREFIEETGVSVTVKNLFMIFEHQWGKEKIQHEINFIFFVKIQKKEKIDSRVKYLSFHWVPLSELNKKIFLPKELKREIKKSAMGASKKIFYSSLK